MITILGAGLTGLTTAHCLTKKTDEKVLVLEKDPFVGGLARTETFGDFRFDLGGHRFYSKWDDLNTYLQELMGDELINVPRSSRILVNDKLVDYPLTAKNALFSTGPLTSVRIAIEYLTSHIQTRLGRSPRSFEDWVISQFGRTIYRIYFEDYSYKVWGMPCSMLSADFAAQRIRGLSLAKLIKDALSISDRDASSLIRAFWYPKKGFGRITDRLEEAIRPQGDVRTSSPATKVIVENGRVRAVETPTERIDTETLISSIPATQLVRMLDPLPPENVLAAAKSLSFRDLVIVFMTFDRPQITQDTWLYFPDINLSFGRLHEPKNWSIEMSPENKTSLVVEWFAWRDDAVWKMQDDEIVQIVSRDLQRTGIWDGKDLEACRVLRIEDAYPIYTLDYQQHLDTIFDYVFSIKGLYTTGRNGLFRYTSGDRCMEIGMKTADVVLGEGHDLRSIALEQEYAEEK